MRCPICEVETHPVFDLNASGKPVAICGKCQAPMPEAQPAPPAPPPRVAAGDVSVTLEPQPRRVAVPRPPFQPAPAAPAYLPTSDGVVASARDRLAVVDAELKRMAGLQRERRMLVAMIAAAETEQEHETPAAAE